MIYHNQKPLRLSLLSFTHFSSNVTEPIRISQFQNLISFVIKGCLPSLTLSQQLPCSVCDSSNGHCITLFGMRKNFGLLVHSWQPLLNFSHIPFSVFMGYSSSWSTPPTQLSLFTYRNHILLKGLRGVNRIAGLMLISSTYFEKLFMCNAEPHFMWVFYCFLEGCRSSSMSSVDFSSQICHFLPSEVHLNQ